MMRLMVLQMKRKTCFTTEEVGEASFTASLCGTNLAHKGLARAM